jgi:hypothetical protein
VGDWGPGASLVAALGLDGLMLPPLGLLTTLVTTSGAVAMAMAFSIFGRRRRDDDLPDGLALEAARGVGVQAVSHRPEVAHAVATGPVTAPAAVSHLEASMPRWRRPSLLLARKADPLRNTVAAPRLSFDHGLVGPIAGNERRFIRYNVVSLLDTPDEVRGSVIGALDQGDEVQLLERRGVYWLVLCPDGSKGWLHKMTLGDVVEPAGSTTGATATLPIAADSWTLGGGEDQDVLAAYLEARRRT